MKILGLTITAETITAVCALLISFISLIFTWLSLRYQRQHNYKSVRPIGIIDLGTYLDHIFVRVKNCGVGPLIIKSVLAKHKNISATNIIDIVEKELSVDMILATFARELENNAIPIGEHVDLIAWVPRSEFTNEKNIQEKKLLLTVLKDMSLTIRYTDIYEKNNFLVEIDMSAFGRYL